MILTNSRFVLRDGGHQPLPQPSTFNDPVPSHPTYELVLAYHRVPPAATHNGLDDILLLCVHLFLHDQFMFHYPLTLFCTETETLQARYGMIGEVRYRIDGREE
jgi:hypothetical protein